MEPLVTIAIPDNAGAAARLLTLAALTRHTPQPHEVVLFVEEQLNYSIAAQARQHIATQSGGQVRQLPVPLASGIPFALNRLLETSTTPYILLLESGAVVTEGWLQRLLTALQDATVGLCGPSTNISWNEQQVVPHGLGTHWSIAQIDTCATEVASRYADQHKSLHTLHSLSDFCYLFKREVVEALGCFDESYGAGPCWEIDFNTRAARAGYLALWVSDAYVHRSYRAFPRGWETLFAANKQLYQDRFCGLRLRGEKKDYEEHCRGEECEHFAPAAFIQIKRNKPLLTTTMALQEQADDTKGAVQQSVPPNLPLVSCIMPTHNRRAFVRQSLLYFERQDYPNKELVIVDDGDDQIADLVASHPLVRYMALPHKTSIGEKRNIACELARGSIIAHWDDDDWYAPHRLSYQVAPLLAKQVDVTALETSCFFDLPSWQAWTCSPDLHRRLFVRDVHGGTLVYWRNIWGPPHARYPHQSLAEDALFLQLVCNRGARLRKLPHAHSFAYIRHGSNAWNIAPGSHFSRTPSFGWQRVEPHDFIPTDDLTFYIPFSPVASASIASTTPATTTPTSPALLSLHIPSPASHAGDTPLVSCIMPTCNRRPFVRQAIAYFLRQDYPWKELIIVDDGSDAIDDLVPPDAEAGATIRSIRLPAKTVLGTKRNIACEHAQGSIIVHWDDDDWHAQHRLRYQVEALLSNKADICGISTLLFYDIRSGLAWQYTYAPGHQAWVSGSTLCYQRAFWANNRFESIPIGEDSRFVWHNPRARVQTLPDTTFHVGIIHAHNTSPKHTNAPLWRAYPATEVRTLLGDDLGFYDAMMQQTSLPAR